MGRGSRRPTAATALDDLLHERSGARPDWLMESVLGNHGLQRRWLQQLSGGQPLEIPSATGQMVAINHETDTLLRMFGQLLDGKLEVVSYSFGNAERPLNEIALTQRAPHLPIEVFASDGQHRFELDPDVVEQWRPRRQRFEEDARFYLDWLSADSTTVVLSDDHANVEIQGISGAGLCSLLEATLGDDERAVQEAVQVVYLPDRDGTEHPGRLRVVNKGIGARESERVTISASLRGERAEHTLSVSEARRMLDSQIV